MFYVDTTGWVGRGDFSDGLHPNVQGRAKVTTHLVAAIKKIGFPGPPEEQNSVQL
jgi:hypothetical protein